MITENLSTLKIHKLTQAQYDRELDAGNIDESALYLTPDVEYQEKHITATVTLAVSGWSSLSQTISVDGITANNTVVITPDPASHTTYGEFGIYCSVQADGALTFTCSETPTVDLTVNVLILN